LQSAFSFKLRATLTSVFELVASAFVWTWDCNSHVPTTWHCISHEGRWCVSCQCCGYDGPILCRVI